MALDRFPPLHGGDVGVDGEVVEVGVTVQAVGAVEVGDGPAILE